MKLKIIFHRYKLYFLIVSIILAGFISYINVYNNEFLWDDEFLIQKNKFIRSFTYLPEIFTTCLGAGAGRLDNFYRPTQLVMYTFIYYLEGLKPGLFHFLNVFLHLFNALLIFFLIRKIFKKESVAFLTSLLWVIHPIHTEAITHMSGTADPLSVLFALSSFLFYINFREKKRWSFLIVSCSLFILALLSKEIIIILPVLLILYEFISINKKSDLSQYKWIMPFLIIAAIYFLMRLSVLNFGGTLNFYSEPNIYSQHLSVRIFTFLASLLMYYSFLLFPVNLYMERQFPVFVSPLSSFVFVSILILVFLFFLAYKSIKSQKPVFAFGVLWFFISFLPMSGIIPVNSFLLEHWLYLPSVGFFLVVSLLICKLFENKKYRKIAVGSVVLLVIILMSLTINRNLDWKDPITFYNNILRYEEGTARIHNNLAMAHAEKGNLKAAEEHYLKAIEISDEYAQTHYNLARLYLRQGQVDKAIFHLNRSIEINPNFFFSYQLFGNIYELQGDYELARSYYQKAENIRLY